jgi:hypothetical protein
MVQVFLPTERKKFVKSVNSLESVQCWLVKLVNSVKLVKCWLVSCGIFYIGPSLFLEGGVGIIGCFWAQIVVFWAEQVLIGHVFGINK